MKKISTIILLLGVSCFFQFSSNAAPVDAQGVGNSTQLATVNALRNAVAQGAGVDVSSRTLVENFMIQHDRIITASEGFVKNYNVVSDIAAKDGTHTVTIQAEVGQGRPGMTDISALRLIYEKMEQPRVLIVCNEKVEGLTEYSSKTLQFLLTDMANSAGFSVIDMENAVSEKQRVALIDKFLKNSAASEVKLSDINKPFELLIVAELTGKVGAVEKNVAYNGIKARNFSFTMNLKAVWRDTSENVAVLTCGPISGACANPALLESPDQLMASLIKDMISGTSRGLEKSDTAINFYEKIICKWIKNLDKGSNITLTFNDLDDAALKKLTGKDGLSKVNGVTNVRVRTFMPGLQSVIELNGSTTANDLKSEVTRILDGRYKVHHMDRSSVEFDKAKPGEVVVVESSSSGGGGEQPASSGGGGRSLLSSPILWIGVGVVALFFAVIAIVVVIVLLKKK
ncbi:MAG TPA: hypothetical protein DCZ94_06045 [Lentisphaeria bacterium]|nr:MAG: hypothetical protein A2X48_21885 [Lentisphaerae bacterium GWF2_49_21]HBC86498.1 hypothetical protein [Lentisphaeria bacterium]